MINTPLISTIENCGNSKSLRVKFQFDDEIAVRLTAEITQTDPISVDLKPESRKTLRSHMKKMMFLTLLLQQ